MGDEERENGGDSNDLSICCIPHFLKLTEMLIKFNRKDKVDIQTFGDISNSLFHSYFFDVDFHTVDVIRYYLLC